MTEKIISNITSLQGQKKALQFKVVFIDCYGHTEEFIFICNSLSQCINQCTGLVNYLFRYSGWDEVYIFPTNSAWTYHNVYARKDGYLGECKIMRCKKGVPLTLTDVKSQFNDL